jgi:hypothetical protein
MERGSCMYSLTKKVSALVCYSCIALRKHMTLCAQKLKMRCAHKSGAAAVCAKLKAMSKLAYQVTSLPTQALRAVSSLL